MTEAGWTGCGDCGMPCASSEYHPYAACLMFKHCRNSETVRANLQAVRQQGRVAGLREAVPLACKYCNDRTKWTPMSNSGYHVCNMPEPGFVRCQAIKIHAALAQQAQDEKGVMDGKESNVHL